MKKKVLMLLSIVLLSGCTAEYNLEFKDDALKQQYDDLMNQLIESSIKICFTPIRYTILSVLNNAFFAVFKQKLSYSIRLCMLLLYLIIIII